MVDHTTSNAGRFETPGTYRIRVKGVVDPKWSDWLGGMQITTHHHRGKDVLTEIVGRVTDQAALAGILDALYQMQLLLVSVEYLNGE